MRVYCITPQGDRPYYFRTRAEADKFARDIKSEPYRFERVTLVPMDKAAILRLLNQSGGYVDSCEVIEEYEPASEV